ncbi:MAG: efflux RND transporter periplasmic adaptor subunit [Phascolarctobacterium sp.]|nr:efflux RND transporter periplasmic adaptor subunit [Phascolarctobacterium sp.]
MEFIWKHKKTWSVLAILTTVIVILFTIFGGVAEEEVAMKGKVVPKRIYLSFNMEYPIEKMYVQVGDEVHKGDVLGVLQMEDLKAQAEDAKRSISAYEETLKDTATDKEAKKLAYSKLNGLRADLLLKEKFLRQGRIVSPIDGVVSLRLQEPGDMAVAMQPVYYLEVPNSKCVQAYADEAYVKRLARGKKVEVMTEIMPMMTVEGNINSVATEAEVLPEEWAKATGTTKGYEVLVDVQDKKDMLHYGMDVLVVVK